MRVDPEALLQRGLSRRTSRVASVSHSSAISSGLYGNLALVRADVRDHLVGVDNRLRLEQQGRGGDARQRVERLDQQMGFGQVLAAGAHLLPDEGQRVEPQHLHALVRQEQHLLGHAR